MRSILRSGKTSLPENVKNEPLVCNANDLNAFALAVTKYDSASTNQTKTRTFASIALWISGAMVLSMLGSSMWGVMKRMARFIPGCGVAAATVSNAMEKVCRLGVVLRKSGLNESRLTNQSFVFA